MGYMMLLVICSSGLFHQHSLPTHSTEFSKKISLKLDNSGKNNNQLELLNHCHSCDFLAHFYGEYHPTNFLTTYLVVPEYKSVGFFTILYRIGTVCTEYLRGPPIA